MDCKEMQEKYIPFIDNELSVKELEAFLCHLEECQDCREEYDIYYTLIMGTRYLEDDSARGWVDSGEKLQIAHDDLRMYRFLRWGKITALVILCIGCMMMIT